MVRRIADDFEGSVHVAHSADGQPLVAGSVVPDDVQLGDHIPVVEDRGSKAKADEDDGGAGSDGGEDDGKPEKPARSRRG